MPDETRISYEEVCVDAESVCNNRAAAYEFEHEINDYPDGLVRAEELRQLAAALRSLAALVERAEAANGWSHVTHDQGDAFDGFQKLIRDIAAGYAPTDPKEGESNG